MKKHYSLLLIILLFFTACKKEIKYVKDNSGNQTTLQFIQNNFGFTIFYAGLKKTGFDKTLSGTGPFTVLAPDNDAFAKIGIRSEADLNLMDTAALRKMIAMHILPGKVFYKDVPQTVNNEYKSISGVTLYFSKPLNTSGNPNAIILHINGDTVLKTDINPASDGIIQQIAKPLNAPSQTVKDFLNTHAQYSYLVTAFKKFNLFDQLAGEGPFTVFAPTNTAFLVGNGFNYGDTGLVVNNISLDSIARLDTLHFSRFLFGGYIFTPNRVFTTDFNDTINNSPDYYRPDGNATVTARGGQPASLKYVVIKDNLFSSLGANTNQITAPDIYLLNGIVHGMDDLLVYPENVRIKN